MFTRWILLFTLAISSWLLARASFVETAMDNYVKEVTKSCPSDGIPVCGVRGRDFFLFPNQCWFDEVNAEDLFGLLGNIKKVSIKYCITGCDLMCPQVYEPVCTLNVHTQEQQMFRNMCEVTQYACRTNVDFLQLHPTACPQTRDRPQSNVRHQYGEVQSKSMQAYGKRSRITKSVPVPCTGVFRPVCGSFMGVKSTFKNECLLNAENVKFGKDWRVIKFGLCDEDYSNVRRNPNNKPSKEHSIRKRSYRNIPNHMSFQNRNSPYTGAFKPDVVMSSNDDFYKYIPNIFHTHYVQRDLTNSALKDQVSNQIIQKIISLPAPTLDATSQGEVMKAHTEGDQQFVVSNDKPLQYRGNNMNFLYNRHNSKTYENLPSASLALERNEHISSESQAMDINSFAENSGNNEDSYYYQTVDVSTSTTPVPKKIKKILETTTNSTPVVRKIKKLPKATTTSPVPATTSPSVEHIFIISRRTTPKSVASKKLKEATSIKSNVCKLGNEPICGVLSNGTVRTFETICEMMVRNAFLKNTWVKLHNGACETCKTNCSREFRPICVQRNGVNYTMVNECYYNMGICMDKRSTWKKIDNAECKRYTRIPDKYENMKPGFQYTSKYFVTSTTPAVTYKTSISSTTSTSVTSTTSTVPTTKATPTKGATSASRRRYRKRISSTNRKVARRSRPPVSSRNGKTLNTVVMNLAKRRKRLNHSTLTD